MNTMKNISLFFIALFSICFSSLSAQNNSNKNIQLQIIPAQYSTIFDTIIVRPALNAAYDTSNYFVQTEIVILKEPSRDWSRLSSNKVCLQQKAANYTLVEVKFYPYKNILDVEKAAEVIPAESIVVERQIITQAAQLKRLNSEDAAALKAEDILTLPAYTWASFKGLLSFCQISNLGSNLGSL
jgi:hypothetical protein